MFKNRKELQITNRLDLNVGTRCNLNCKFCYTHKLLNQSFLDYNQLKQRIFSYKKLGISKLHINGGEPTIYKSLFELVEFSKSIGFTNLKVITNGIRLKDIKFVEKAKRAGVDSFVISLHGHNAQIHDELTQTQGSFESSMKGIKNLKQVGLPFQINHVVTKHNYKYLLEFSEFMKEICPPEEITLLYFNPMMEQAASKMNNVSVNYKNTIPYLNSCLKNLNSNGFKVFYKFIPFCVLKDTPEKYILNFSQALYDDSEWNYNKRLLLEYGKKKYFVSQIKQFKNNSKEQICSLPLNVLIYLNSLRETFSNYFIKLPSCKFCKYDYVCLGVAKYYIDMYGREEFQPVSGKKIINPVYFSHNAYRIKSTERVLNKILYYISKHLCTKRHKTR